MWYVDPLSYSPSGVSSGAFLWPAARRLSTLVGHSGMSQPESNSDPQEVELLNQIAGRDLEAFSRLYDRFVGVLFSVVMSILKDPGQTEDVLQEVFLQIWDRAGVYDRQLGKPLSWVVALARNKAIDRLRSTQRRNRLLSDVAIEETEASVAVESTTGAIIGNETAALVHAALKTLSAEQRQAIELAYFGGLTQTEIAATLKQPLGTVKARVRRGMLQLRDALKGQL